jgi:CBS domain-containing protein
MRHTINTERLVRRGTLVPDAYEIDAMKMLRVRDIMNPEVESVRSDRQVRDFLASVAAHESVPVVDAHDHVQGIIYRRDLLRAAPEDKAISLAHAEYPVAYNDEVVFDVARRFLDGNIGRCVVLDRESGELAGMLTAFDVLKAKNWEMMQEMPEPSRLAGRSLLRFSGKNGKKSHS